MKLLRILTIMFCLSIASLGYTQGVIDDPEREERIELLMTHGINDDPASIINFLENGFTTEIRRIGLPRAPRAKSTVVNAAIGELGIIGDPIAVPLLSRIARRDVPLGMEGIIAADFEGVPISELNENLLLARRVFSMNAIVSLGLIGDDKGAPAIREVMATEPASGFVTRGAEALALMGLSDGIEPLLRLAEQQIDNNNGVAAMVSLYAITGRNYGITEQSSLAKRRQMIAEARKWYAENKDSINIFRHDVLRRLDNPPVAPEPDPLSLRGLLRGTLDVGNYDRRYFSRQRLTTEAAARYDELRGIAEDRNEDVDIRRAALQWLVMVDSRKARSTVRRLKNDENAVVAQTAVSLESQPTSLRESSIRN